MKRILIFAVVLSLLVPAAAFAATEFSLGGYIKLDTYWDSTENNKNMVVRLTQQRSAGNLSPWHT